MITQTAVCFPREAERLYRDERDQLSRRLA